MTTKLILTVDKSTIEKAKSYAKRNGRSLSELVEKYLETITYNEDLVISPKLKGILGSVALPADFDEKSELHKYFKQKHL